jgi:hypothetical protein
MRFIPAPEQDARVLSAAPALELRLDANVPEITVISSLRAITDTHTGDVLLPSLPVDVRFLQSRYFELYGRAADSRLAWPVADFLEKSHLRPDEGNLLTPARVEKLLLPRRFFASSSEIRASENGEKGVDNAPDSRDLIAVDYIFAGLEVRRAVATDFEGWRLVYTSIEAGQGGGRRAELALEAVPAERDGEVTPATHKALHFVEAVSKLSRGVDFKWYGNNQ